MPRKTSTNAKAIAKEVPVCFITFYTQFRKSAFFVVLTANALFNNDTSIKSNK